MRNIAFDEVIHSEFSDSVIDYGIIYGSNTIVFIKAGQDGSMCGYKNKYLRIAIDINEKYGYTVICSSNLFDGINPLDNAMDVIKEYCSKNSYDSYKVYYMGHSAGGLIGLWYGVDYPVIERMVIVNSPLMYNWPKTKDGIKRFKGERLTLVYGSKDQSIGYIELAKALENDKVKVDIVEGADHHFSGMENEFEEIPDKWLIKDY